MQHRKNQPDFHLEGTTLTMILNGDIDHHSSKNVRAELDQQIFLLRPQKIILDLSRVEFMDSSGLGLILGRYTKACELGCEFFLKNPNEKVKKILDLAGVERLIGMIPSSESSGEKQPSAEKKVHSSEFYPFVNRKEVP